MKIAVTPYKIENIHKLALNGADIFILGNDDYASRLVNSFELSEIVEASKIIEKLEKELYISVNIIAHNSTLNDITEFLNFLGTIKLSGIIFGDLGVYMIAKRLGLESKLIYNPETLNTSFYDPKFWKRKGIKGITISKEITLDDIEEISNKSNIEISIIGHGHLNMFHSRRPLIENYFKYTKEEYDSYINNRNLKIVEEIRNEEYPIFQDKHGTHIFREKALESFQEVIKLNKFLDVFIIDSIFKDDEYLLEVLMKYKHIINTNNLEESKKYTKIYETDHDSGFLYKKTVYDKY